MEMKKKQERQRAGITVITQHGHEQRVCCASASFSATVFHHQVKMYGQKQRGAAAVGIKTKKNLFVRCDQKKKAGDFLFFFTSLGESRSSIVSAGSLEHATSDRATMHKPARPGSETTPWLFPEKLQRDEAAFSLRLLRYS